MEEAFGRRKACFAGLNKERMCKTCIFGRETVSLKKKKRNETLLRPKLFPPSTSPSGKKREKGEGASGRSARNCQNEDDRTVSKQNKTKRGSGNCIQVITQYFRPNQSARGFPEEQGRLRVTGMPIENFRKAEVDSYRVISLLHHLFFSFGVTGIYKDAPLH